MTDTEPSCLHCLILEVIERHVQTHSTLPEAVLQVLGNVVADIVTASGEERQKAITRFTVAMMGSLLMAALEEEDAVAEPEPAAEGLDDATIEQLRELLSAKGGTSH